MLLLYLIASESAVTPEPSPIPTPLRVVSINTPIADVTGSGDSTGLPENISGDGYHLLTDDGDTNIPGEAIAPNIFALSGCDSVVGTESADLISANEGADTLFGKGNDDLLFGGKASDWLDGGDGNDFICGESNSDNGFSR